MLDPKLLETVMLENAIIRDIAIDYLPFHGLSFELENATPDNKDVEISLVWVQVVKGELSLEHDNKPLRLVKFEIVEPSDLIKSHLDEYLKDPEGNRYKEQSSFKKLYHVRLVTDSGNLDVIALNVSIEIDMGDVKKCFSIDYVPEHFEKYITKA